MLMLNRLRGSWTRYVDCLLTPSAFLRDKLVQGGLPASKIVVRSNAIEAPAYEASNGERAGFLYVGRLAPNKGIESLMRAWSDNGDLPHLRIAGAGELESDVRAAANHAPGRIEYLGALSRDQVFEAMRSAQALVFPSVWYETQGLTILEAFASGTPVIASRIGAVPEAVIDGDTGLLFTPGDASDVAAKVRWAAGQPQAMQAMGENALMAFRERYAPEQSIVRLEAEYERLAGQATVNSAAGPLSGMVAS
jgi:glycosyltransferase involved in cell wall biosynthesis